MAIIRLVRAFLRWLNEAALTTAEDDAFHAAGLNDDQIAAIRRRRQNA